jgi:hypothetical protein
MKWWMTPDEISDALYALRGSERQAFKRRWHSREHTLEYFRDMSAATHQKLVRALETEREEREQRERK